MARNNFYILCALFLYSWSFSLAAMSTKSGLSAGFMIQPNSQYYHNISGGYVGISTDDESFSLDLSYLERPYFESQNYVDGENALFCQLASKIHLSKYFGLTVFLGYGQTRGYLRDVESLERRSYAINGASLAAEYSLNFSLISLAMQYQTFVGIKNREQLRSYVVWPFNFFIFKMGLIL